jgi:hypothetical protein
VSSNLTPRIVSSHDFPEKASWSGHHFRDPPDILITTEYHRQGMRLHDGWHL